MSVGSLRKGKERMLCAASDHHRVEICKEKFFKDKENFSVNQGDMKPSDGEVRVR